MEDFKKELDKQFSGLNKWITDKVDQSAAGTPRPRSGDEGFIEALGGVEQALKCTDPEQAKQWYLWSARTGEWALQNLPTDERWVSVADWYCKAGDDSRVTQLLETLLTARARERGYLSLCLDIPDSLFFAFESLPGWCASWLLEAVRRELERSDISPGDVSAALRISARGGYKAQWARVWQKALEVDATFPILPASVSSLRELPVPACYEALEASAKAWVDHREPFTVEQIREVVDFVQTGDPTWYVTFVTDWLPRACDCLVKLESVKVMLELAKLVERIPSESKDSILRKVLEILTPKLGQHCEYDLLPLVPVWDFIPASLKVEFPWRPEPLSAVHHLEKARQLALRQQPDYMNLESDTRGALDYLTKELANYSVPPSESELQEVRSSLLGALVMLWNNLWLGYVAVLTADLSNQPIRLSHPSLEYMTKWLELVTRWIEEPKPLTTALLEYGLRVKERDLQSELEENQEKETLQRQIAEGVTARQASLERFLAVPPVCDVPSRYNMPEWLPHLAVIFVSNELRWAPSVDDQLLAPVREQIPREGPLFTAFGKLAHDFCAAESHYIMAEELLAAETGSFVTHDTAVTLAVIHLRAALTLDQQLQKAWDKLVKVLSDERNLVLYRSWVTNLMDACKRAKTVTTSPDGTKHWRLDATTTESFSPQELLAIFFSGQIVVDPIGR